MNLGGVVRVNKWGVFLILAVVVLLLIYATSRGVKEGSKLTSISTGDHLSLKLILAATIDVAVRGGEEVVRVRNTFADLQEKIKGETKEGAKERVTKGDFLSHRIMYYGLRKAFPNIKVISEEHSDPVALSEIPLPNVENQDVSDRLNGDEEVNAHDVAVWIDPLDATQEYTENELDYVTTMVCVAVKGVPLLGVIHRPFQKETYWAIVGLGHSASLDSQTNKSRQPPNKVKILVSRSHTGEAAQIIKNVMGNTPFEIVKAAGSGYKVLEVLKGEGDAYVHVTAIKKWDTCAGHAIISAMGGTMETLEAKTIDYSPDSNPLNDKGLLVYKHDDPNLITKLRSIHI